jgi:hypothetical protein
MLDVRVPVGLMFATMGTLLAGHGLFADQSNSARSLGVNINLVWGLVMIVFAITMLALAKLSRRD